MWDVKRRESVLGMNSRFVKEGGGEVVRRLDMRSGEILGGVW